MLGQFPDRVDSFGKLRRRIPVEFVVELAARPSVPFGTLNFYGVVTLNAAARLPPSLA